MACSITVRDVFGIVPAGQAEITVLRVTGDAIDCTAVEVSSGALGIAATTVAVVSGEFSVDLPITVSPKPDCGDQVDVTVVCSSEQGCESVANYQLQCCSIEISHVFGITPGHAIHPTQIHVDGVALGCPTQKVNITVSFGGVVIASANNLTVDPALGGFSAVMAITSQTPIDCGAKVTVVASCVAGAPCQISDDFVLSCPDCYRVEATVDLSQPCTGVAGAQTKPVTITANIGLPTGTNTKDLFWDYGTVHGAPFTVTVTQAAPLFTHVETQQLPPGHYHAVLRFVHGLPEACLEYTRDFDVTCDSGVPGCPTWDPPSVASVCVNGKRTVTFTAHLTAPAGQTLVAQWDFDSTGTSLGTALVAGPGQTVNPPAEHHDFPPGSYTAHLHTISPANSNCPDPPIPFVVPPCPTGSCEIEITDISVVVGACDPVTGMREVTATATASGTLPTDGCVWQWDTAIPGDPSVPVGPTNTGLTASHHYAAPGTASATHTITLHIRRDDDCSTSRPKDVPIDGCGTACPDVTIQIDQNGVCTPDGLRRLFNLDATASLPGVMQYTWNFGDGATQVLPGTSAATTHAFAPGTWTVTLDSLGPGNCSAHVPTQITVPPCCPTITGVDVSQAPCIKGTAMVAVTLTAQATGEQSTFTWDFGDGSTPVTGPQAPTHNYAPGTYTVTVTANAPGCPPVTSTPQITVNPCSETAPPSQTSIDACTALLWTAIILSIIGAIAVLVGCVMAKIPYLVFVGEILEWVGIGVIALAALLYLLWWILCRFITPCAVLLTVIHVLMALIPIFAVITVIVGWLGSFDLGCWIKSVVTFAYWGTVLGTLYWLANNRHCVTENPNGPPPPASSSSGLSSGDPTRVLRQRPTETEGTRGETIRPLQAVASDDPEAVAVRERPRPAGVGDMIKNATSAIGIKPCAGCHQRAEQLNRVFPLGRQDDQQAETAS